MTLMAMVTATVQAQTESSQPSLSPIASPSAADDLHPLWLNFGMVSHHLQNDATYNDHNGGAGLEWGLKPGYSLTAGQFYNSNYATSHYVGAYLMPLSWGPVRFGVAAGGFNGYPTYKGGGWFAAAIPAMSIEGERFGVNVLYVPAVIPEVASVLSFQLKIKMN